MTNSLQQYFPMIRTRDEILAEIQSSRKLHSRFLGWTEDQQTEFLDFCSGTRGVKILYDSFSKEILSPESTPERLEDLLSLLLKKSVRILYALPNDSTRIADENTLLITDIVVELEDGSIANIEVQKIGYKFPGERSACYSADMLLRQYKRVRDTKKRNFSYEDIKSVYTIVLFETSPALFHAFPNVYLHSFQQRSDSGLELELLQKYIFIPLDIFQKNRHNEPIQSRLDAWLTFFSEDKPERIAELICTYPEFKFMYEDIYRICRNTEEIMGIFSEELRILDRNTVQLMIDEMQDELDAQRLKYALQKDELNAEREKYAQQQSELNAEREKYAQQQNELNAEREKYAQQQSELNAEREKYAQQQSELNAEREKYAQQQSELNAEREKCAQQQNELNAEREKNALQQQELDTEREKLREALKHIEELENLKRTEA